VVTEPDNNSHICPETKLLWLIDQLRVTAKTSQELKICANCFIGVMIQIIASMITEAEYFTTRDCLAKGEECSEYLKSSIIEFLKEDRRL
jgi:hypothetical protein